MKEFRIQPIKNGTVIDHIDSGKALKVIKIMGVDENVTSIVSVIMHVPSSKKQYKDIVKVEDRELNPKELQKIALIAPNATINIIRDYEVVKKTKVKPPERVTGIVRCANPNCITNAKTAMDTFEPVEPEFIVESTKPLKLRCVYCERELENPEEHLI